MKIGLALPHYTPTSISTLLDIAVTADEQGFDSLWVSDHLVFDLGKYGGAPDLLGAFEPLSLLSALAVVTKRARLGTLVLCNEFRHPAILAKQAAAIDQLSSGRLDLGIGAGWYEREFEMFGFPYPAPGARLDKLKESIVILRGLFAGGPFSFEGEHYKLDGAACLPAPTQAGGPPIMIGGKGPRTMRIAAKLADAWNGSWISDAASFVAMAAPLGDSPIRRQAGVYASKDSASNVALLGELAEADVDEVVMCFSTVPFGLDDRRDIDEFAAHVLPVAKLL